MLRNEEGYETVCKTGIYCLKGVEVMLKHTKTTVSVCNYQARFSSPRGMVTFEEVKPIQIFFPYNSSKMRSSKKTQEHEFGITLEGHSSSASSVSGTWTNYTHATQTGGSGMHHGQC